MARLDRYNNTTDRKNKGFHIGREKTDAQKRLAERRKNLKKKRPLWNKFTIVKLVLILAVVLFVGFKVYGWITTYTPVRVTDKNYTHAKKYENYLAVNGIDVSEHQKNSINWKKVKYSGVDFVFVRVGYRSTDKGTLGVDARYKENIEGAKKAGLMVGAYYYSQAINQAEAEAEADAMLELVDGYDLDLPLVIDYELYSGGRLEKEIAKGNMTTASAYHNIVLAFCRRVENAGYDSGIYANYDMFSHYMDASYIEKESNLWVAQFGGNTSLKAGYRFWQCSENERVGGISGGVDHDFMYLNPEGVTKVWYATSPHKTSLEGSKISFKKKEFRHKNTGVKPKVTVTGPDGKRLWKNRDYTVSYVNNVHKGTGYVIIRGTGNYRDIVIKSFAIK